MTAVLGVALLGGAAACTTTPTSVADARYGPGDPIDFLPTPTPDPTDPTDPGGLVGGVDLHLPAAYAIASGRLAVVLGGSGSCPDTATRIDASGMPASATITFTPVSGDTVCTMDYVPWTFVFDASRFGGELPTSVVIAIEGQDRADDVTVLVEPV